MLGSRDFQNMRQRQRRRGAIFWCNLAIFFCMHHYVGIGVLVLDGHLFIAQNQRAALSARYLAGVALFVFLRQPRPPSQLLRSCHQDSNLSSPPDASTACLRRSLKVTDGTCEIVRTRPLGFSWFYRENISRSDNQHSMTTNVASKSMV